MNRSEVEKVSKESQRDWLEVSLHQLSIGKPGARPTLYKTSSGSEANQISTSLVVDLESCLNEIVDW